ncbi:hypothetical protein D9615_005479 [Tricholomella constricta]|uniref:ABC transporter domain-containing protein n=1 Tax=Tricholomella constricta TaxID=117010 RepID=A0A8H5HE83_9AGAR|nr:hypothetical protein D9615_005479 [Tricholomella constricta]
MSTYTAEDALKDIPAWIGRTEAFVDKFDSDMSSRGPWPKGWKTTLEDLQPPILTVAFIGGTGAGKSTLINAIVGMEAEPARLSSQKSRITAKPKNLVGDIRDDMERDRARIEKAKKSTRAPETARTKVSEAARKSWETLTAVYNTLTLDEFSTQCLEDLHFC